MASTPVLCLCSCAGGLLLGYDLGIVPGVIMFVRDELSLDHTWQQLVVSCTVACAAIGSLLAMLLVHFFGRKNTVACASLCFLTGVVTLLFTTGCGHLIVGRCIQGLAIGICSATIPGVISDLADKRRRGVLLSLFPMCFVTGQFLAAVVAALGSQYRIGWRAWFGLEFGPAILLLSTCVFGIKTRAPKHVPICKTSSSTSVKCGCGACCHGKPTSDDNDRADNGNESTGTSLLQTPGMARLLFIGCLVHVMQQFSGINTVMFYTGTVLEAAGVQDRTCALWLACVPLGVNLLVMAASLPFVDLCGRRPLFLGSVLGVFVCLLVLAGGFALHEQALINHVPILVALSVYLMCYSVGLSGLPWTITAELFHDGRHKSVGVAVASGVNWGSNLLVSLTFLTLFDTIGKPGTYLFYAALTALGLTVACFVLPETRQSNHKPHLQTTVSKQPLLLPSASSKNNDTCNEEDMGRELTVINDPRLRPSITVTEGNDEDQDTEFKVLV